MNRFLPLLALAALAFPFPAHAMKKGPTADDLDTLRDAAAVVERLTTVPDQSIPEDLLGKSECILVFPAMKKGAFIVGGKGGKGIASCRGKDGRMGAPAFFHIGGASIGFQWGGSSTDVVMLFMNPEGMEHLLKDRFSIGGDASAAAGPVGRTTTAATDAQMTAQILSWSRSRGLFAGIALDGSVIKPAEEANKRLYGEEVTAREVLVKQERPVPEAAAGFVETARRHTRR